MRKFSIDRGPDSGPRPATAVGRSTVDTSSQRRRRPEPGASGSGRRRRVCVERAEDDRGGLVGCMLLGAGRPSLSLSVCMPGVLHVGRRRSGPTGWPARPTDRRSTRPSRRPPTPPPRPAAADACGGLPLLSLPCHRPGPPGRPPPLACRALSAATHRRRRPIRGVFVLEVNRRSRLDEPRRQAGARRTNGRTDGRPPTGRSSQPAGPGVLVRPFVRRRRLWLHCPSTPKSLGSRYDSA